MVKKYKQIKSQLFNDLADGINQRVSVIPAIQEGLGNYFAEIIYDVIGRIFLDGMLKFSLKGKAHEKV